MAPTWLPGGVHRCPKLISNELTTCETKIVPASSVIRVCKVEAKVVSNAAKPLRKGKSIYCAVLRSNYLNYQPKSDFWGLFQRIIGFQHLLNRCHSVKLVDFFIKNDTFSKC